MRFARRARWYLREASNAFLLWVICDLLCVICVILACLAWPSGGGVGVVFLVELLEDRAGAGDDLLHQLCLGVAIAGGGRDTAMGTDLGGSVGIGQRIVLRFVVTGDRVFVGWPWLGFRFG